MKILILTNYFPPELGAAQSRLGFLTKALVRKGHQVWVVTSLPSYPSGVIAKPYRNRLFVREFFNGAQVLRTWTYARPGKSFVWRLITYLCFSLSCFWALPLLPKIDLIMVESPPVFLGLSGLLFKFLKGSKLAIHVSDLWVKAAIDFGYLSSHGLSTKLLRAMESVTYRFANSIIVVSPTMIEHVTTKHCPPKKITVICNGADTEVFYPNRDHADLSKELKLDGKFVAIYAGTHGNVADMLILIEVAKMLRAYPDIQFLFVGDGVDKPKLIQMAQQNKLRNMTFMNPQPEAQLAKIINMSDVGLSTLKPMDFTDHVIPVKAFTYMACGIPVVSTDKFEPRKILQQSGAGLLVRPGDPGALRDAILELYRDKEKRVSLGRAGVPFIANGYSRQAAAAKMEKLIIGLVKEETMSGQIL